MRTAQLIAEQQAQQGHGGTDFKSVTKPKRKMHPNSLANLVAPWKPGDVPNPGGRRKDVAGEISRAAIEKNASAIYDAIVRKLLAGDAYAFSVHADRGYGKLKQGVVHTGDDEGGPIRQSIAIEFVEPNGK